MLSTAWSEAVITWWDKNVIKSESFSNLYESSSSTFQYNDKMNPFYLLQPEVFEMLYCTGDLIDYIDYPFEGMLSLNACTKAIFSDGHTYERIITYTPDNYISTINQPANENYPALTIKFEYNY